MYRTVSKEFDPEELKGYDMIVFFSPAGIESLKESAPNFIQGDTIIGCFGATTAKAIKDAGFRLDVEAPVEGVSSMSAAIDLFLSKNK
jgi:uroporphyrinogen-III synthase